jgi:predicted Fe-Mo cluster-binding NifX family protein
MKIAVTSNGPSLDAVVETRFGRCPYFLCIDLETQALEAIPNPNMALSGGAGPQSAQLMAEKGVSAVLTGNCGPNAFQAFGAIGIQVITGVRGLVREAVDQFKAGQLKPASTPSVQGHYGTKGMGSGRGMGRGMGMGRSRGMGGSARRMR